MKSASTSNLSKRILPFDEVAERFFTTGEVAALRALPAHLRRQAFYKCWTSKEAFLKAKGTGLSGELDEVKIGLAASGEQVRIEANVPGWSLIELNSSPAMRERWCTRANPLQSNSIAGNLSGYGASVNRENAGKKSKASLPFSPPRFFTMCKMIA